MVSSARNAPSSTMVNFGMQQHGRDLGVRGRPSRRAAAATSASAGWRRAGTGSCARRPSAARSPTAASRPGCAPGGSPRAARWTAPAPRARSAARTPPPRPAPRPASTAVRAAPPGPASGCRGRPTRSPRVRRPAPPAAARPAAARTRRRRATQNGARGGRCSGHGWRALPDLTAGEPFQYWPFFTLADHRRAGCDVGVLADDRAGQQRGARADGRVVADRDPPEVEQVAVDPVPAQVDLGLDGAAVAQRQQAR